MRSPSGKTEGEGGELPSATRQEQEADRRCAKRRCQSPGKLREEPASWQPSCAAEAALSCHGNGVEPQPPAGAVSLPVSLSVSPHRGHFCALQGRTQVTTLYSHRLLCAPLLLQRCASLPVEFPRYVRDLGLCLSRAQPSLSAAMMLVPQEGRRVVPCPKILSDMRKGRGEAVSRSFRNWLLSKLWLVQSPLCAVSIGSIRRASIAH